MESKCERFQKIFFGRIFSGFFKRFFISLLLFFMVYLASANDYFSPPIERKYNIVELEELYEQKNDYRNPHAVCIYIYHIISNDMPKSYESKRLLQKIELYFENCDGSHLPTEDYLFFLSDKSMFYHLKNDEDKMLKTLKQFHIKHPYILDDFHGAAGVKRNTISSILIDSFKKGLLRRPLVVFVSSFDVFSWKEKLFGYFLLPVFAIKNNPLCLLYWLWLVFVIASFITVLYIICKLIKSKKEYYYELPFIKKIAFSTWIVIKKLKR